MSPYAKPVAPEHVVLLTELEDKLPPEPNNEKLNPLLPASQKKESFPSAYFKPFTTSPLAHFCDDKKSLDSFDMSVVNELIPSLPAGPVNPIGPCGPVSPFAPVNPMSPFAPVNPMSPFAPVNPMSPLSPLTPGHTPFGHPTPGSP